MGERKGVKEIEIYLQARSQFSEKDKIILENSFFPDCLGQFLNVLPSNSTNISTYQAV